MINGKQQNILSLDKNNSQSTQNRAAQNLLTQTEQDFLLSQELEIKQNSKQSDTYQNITIYYFDLTLAKSLKSQIVKVDRNRLFNNPLGKIINQENKQSIIISYQKNQPKSSESDQSDQPCQNNIRCFDQAQEGCIKLSANLQNNPIEKILNPQNSQISPSIQKQDQQKIQINPSQSDNQLTQSSDIQFQSDKQKNETQNMLNQSESIAQQQVLLNPKQIIQQSENSQENCSSKSNLICDKVVQNTKEQPQLQKVIKLDQSSFEQNKNQKENNFKQLKEEEIYKQQNLQHESKKSGQISNEDQKSYDLREQEAQQDAQKQQNNKSQDDKKNSQQDKKFQKNSLEQILVIDYQNYQQILDQIQAYQFKEYEIQKQSEFQTEVGNLIERKFNEDIFNNINKNCIKNTHFESMKNNIFISLQQRKFYLSKLLKSNEKQDLFIGYEEQDKLQYENELIYIKYNLSQTEYKITELMLEALNISYQIIDISSNNTYLFVLSADDIENIQNKLKLFNQALNMDLYYSNQKNHFEISLKNQNQCINSKKQIEFLFSFIKEQTYYMCQFNDKQIEGIMLKANKQQITQSLQNFVIYHIFNISYIENSSSQQNKMDLNISDPIQAITTNGQIDKIISLKDSIKQQENAPNQNIKPDRRIQFQRVLNRKITNI
ncbi:hypothetical protein ABPG73_002423 [Tetrahymena malaccensis]